MQSNSILLSAKKGPMASLNIFLQLRDVSGIMPEK